MLISVFVKTSKMSCSTIITQSSVVRSSNCLQNSGFEDYVYMTCGLDT